MVGLKNIILLCDYGYIGGGTEKVAISSAIELSKKNYNIVFFCAVGPICDELKKSNIKIVFLDQKDILNNPDRFEAVNQGIWNKKAEIEMEKLISTLDKKTTIIHVHSWSKALSSSPIKVAVDKGFKIVLTLHDYFTVCPNGGFYNYPKNQICNFTPLSKKCVFCNCDSRKYAYKLWRVTRQIVQGKKGLIPKGIKNYIYISELSKKVLEPYLPEDSYFYYVKNPVDIEKSEPVNIGENKTFVYIGRLSKEKGCLLFAQAAKELGIQVTFIGDGELKGEIKRIYPEANFTGWVDKKRIMSELRKARALVFPSLWYEGLPLTVLEALSMGVPAIVSDTCAAREVVKDKESGLWFKRYNKEDLKEKIKALMNAGIAREYGNNAYEYYWANDFSLKNHTAKLEKVYENILKEDKDEKNFNG